MNREGKGGTEIDKNRGDHSKTPDYRKGGPVSCAHVASAAGRAGKGDTEVIVPGEGTSRSASAGAYFSVPGTLGRAGKDTRLEGNRTDGR